jgi:peptide/nickel transport system permease protein
MLNYTLSRLAIAIPTFLAVLFITFLLTTLSPFDPVTIMMQQHEGTLDAMQQKDLVQRIRDQYGLDDTFLVQFTKYLQRLAQGDLGISVNGQRDVLRMIINPFRSHCGAKTEHLA